MDGFFFTFLPAVFEIGLGVGLPLLGLSKLAPAVMAKRTERLRVKRRLGALEAYAARAHATICNLIVEGDISPASKESLYELQAIYDLRESMTRKSISN